MTNPTEEPEPTNLTVEEPGKSTQNPDRWKYAGVPRPEERDSLSEIEERLAEAEAHAPFCDCLILRSTMSDLRTLINEVKERDAKIERLQSSVESYVASGPTTPELREFATEEHNRAYALEQKVKQMEEALRADCADAAEAHASSQHPEMVRELTANIEYRARAALSPPDTEGGKWRIENYPWSGTRPSDTEEEA